MPFICKCQKLYNDDKTFKFELYFDFYKSLNSLCFIPGKIGPDYSLNQLHVLRKLVPKECAG